MKYSELHYERIDVDKSRKVIDGLIDRFNNASSAEEQINVFKEADEVGKDYMSYSAIASLNFSRDINDEAAKAEKDYYDSIGPDMQEIYDKLDKAVDRSKFKSDLSDKWGETFLKQIELQLKTFDPKIKDLLKQEIDLRNDYTKLTAGAKIDFNGKTYNLSGLGPFHTNKDREIRKSSF